MNGNELGRQVARAMVTAKAWQAMAAALVQQAVDLVAVDIIAQVGPGFAEGGHAGGYAFTTHGTPDPEARPWSTLDQVVRAGGNRGEFVVSRRQVWPDDLPDLDTKVRPFDGNEFS